MSTLGTRYKKQDVLHVWARLAERIRELLKQEKGIVVKGLGTFSLSKWTLETGNNGRILEMRKPIFIISKSLAEEFDLHQRKEYVNDAIPLAPISYQWLSGRCGLSKGTLIGCVEETVQCFRRIVSEGRDVEFPLAPLGNLVIAKTNVSFISYDQCEREIQKPTKPCVKFAAAKVNYRPKIRVPCLAHDGQ
ncbi:coiled-coil domain containing 81 [Nesidiocoris tenuis]|nr:coiled-coil domain containing 81 [Nesidiocoris tenuis]